MGIVVTIIIFKVIMMIRLEKNKRKFNNIDINSHDDSNNNNRIVIMLTKKAV